MATITQDRLKELLHYDPETGLFTHTKSRGRKQAGGIAGTKSGGYIQVGLDYAQYRAHRLAWLYMTGKFPEYDVDHINGKRDDNRWCNLREATRTENMQNLREATSASGSGLLGAFSGRNRWRSQIRVGGKQLNLGTFDTAEEAHAAYVEAKRIHHPGCTI